MNGLKSFLFIPFVNSNLNIIFCSNNIKLYDFKCFDLKHNFFFSISLISLLILIYLNYLFITFSFCKEKKRQSSISKYLIMNSNKSFFWNEIIILLIQNINSIYDIKRIKYFMFFLISSIHLYCFMIEFKFQEDYSINTQLYYYFNFIYFISTTSLFIGYLIRNIRFDGFIYAFFLFIIITISLILITPYRNINNFFFFNFSKDYNVYHEFRVFIKSINERKMSRENLLDFFIFHTMNYKENEEAIDQENFIYDLHGDLDYKLSLFIEDKLRKKINQYNDSILLKCAYAIYLFYHSFKYNKAFLIILSLYDDISEGKISSTLSQEFFIYRMKKNIESNITNLGNNNNTKKLEISIYYQINDLIYLIFKISEIYYDFWNILYNCSKYKDIISLEKLGNKINKNVKEINEKFKLLYKKQLKDKKIIILYSYFLKEVLNENEKSKNILEELEIDENKYEEEINETIGGNNKVYDLNEIESTSNLQFIISSGIKEQSIGLIQKISHDFSKKLGYSSEQLIGESINILIPDFLRNKHDELLRHKFLNYNLKEELKNPKKIKGLYYMKSKALYLIPVYMKIYFIFDEDYNPYNFTKLENDKEIFFHQNFYKNCHVITDNKFIIQNFTVNAIKMLNLNDKDFNGSVDITNYLKEFKEEVKKFIVEDKEYDEDSIKNLLLRKKYFMKKECNFNNNIITWKKNEKTFNLFCEEIKMKDQVLGFYFHFENNNSNNSSSNDKFESVIKDKSKNKPTKKTNSFISINNPYTNKFINGEFKINSNIIPLKDPIINFDFKQKSYVLKKKGEKDNNKLQNIEEYVKELFVKKKIKTKKESDTSNFESENSDSSYSSSENSIEISDDEKKKNKKNLNKIDYYKVNLSHITLYYFDFTKNLIEEIKDFPKENKVEMIMNKEEEKNNKIEINKKRKSSLIKEKKKKLNNYKLDLQKEKEINNKNDEIIKSIISSQINSSIYHLIFSILLTFFFSIFFTVFFVIFSYNFNKPIFRLINALNCLKDLNKIIGETFYYSVKLTITQNPKYTTIKPSKEEIKSFSRNILLSMYNEMLNLLNSLYFNSVSFSNKNLIKIQNYKVKLSTLTKLGNENITEVPVLNLLEEYTSFIYLFVNNDDSKINFLNYDFNEILKNSQNFLYGFYNDYTLIYEDEYKLKIKYAKVFTYCICFSLIPFIFLGLYLILISSFKVSSEKEKYINFFFQIDKKTILTSMKNCKKFIKATCSNSNYSSKYLITTPKINLQILEKNNLSEFDDLDDNYFFQENNNNYINKKTKEDEEEEEELSDYNEENETLELKKENKLNSTYKFFKYEKKVFKYLFLYIIFFFMMTAIIITIKFMIDNKYYIIEKYHEIYSCTNSLKTFVTRNIIFFRVYIAYKSSHLEILFINKISEDLKERFDRIFYDHSKIIKEMNMNVDKNFLSKRTKNFYKKIQLKSLCSYLEDYINNNGGSCDSFGFGIAKYGLNSITTYILHSMVNLFYEVLHITSVSESKGFLYSEIFYGTEFYYNFSKDIPESQIEEYNKYEPFSLFNNNVMRHLIILNDNVVKACIDEASHLVKDDIQNIGNVINKLLVSLLIMYISFIILFSLFYVIPDVIKKNNNINKRRKILMIIPKNVLLDIISKNN